jgi:hypothetical protein
MQLKCVGLGYFLIWNEFKERFEIREIYEHYGATVKYW